MTGRAMNAGTAATRSGAGRQPVSAVANGDGPQITGDYSMTDISKTEPVPATNQAGEERAAIVSYIRRQSDRGADLGNEKPKGSTARAAFGGGSLALKRVADNIEAGEHVINDNAALATQPATSQEGEGTVAKAYICINSLGAQLRRSEITAGDHAEKVMAILSDLAATPTPPKETREAELQAEIERLRSLLIDPGDPAWEDARAVLVAELRKNGMGTHADNIALSHAVPVPSWIALNLIAHARITPTPPTLSEDLRALSERATPGPWAWEQCGEMEDVPVIGIAFPSDDPDCKTPYEGEFRDSDASRMTIAYDWQTCDGHPPSANAAFAVAAVNYVRAALARAQVKAS